MEKRLAELRELLLNKVFYHSDTDDSRMRKTYFCKEIDTANNRFKIVCDGRTFVYLESELSTFLSKIKIETGVALVSENSHPAEVIPQPGRMENLSNSLYNIFEQVSSGKASKEDIDKAKTLVSVSNQIIGIEKIKLMQQSFKNKF